MKHTLIIKSIGTANPGIARVIAEAFQINHDLLIKQLYNAPAVFLENAELEIVEKAAALLADHPQPPPEEKARIIGLFGAEMGRFKGYDTETHDYAMAADAAAKAGDGQAVIRAFGQLQNSCLACHTTFREPFVAHFYGKKITP